jgi:spore germination protein KB
LILLVLCGGLVNGAFTLKQDTWIAILFMGVLYLPMILIYSRICRLFPGKGLFDIIEAVSGRTGNVVFVLIITFYALFVSGLVLQNYTEFTVVISLQQTPYIPIMILILLASLYLAAKGPKLLGRWSFIICILIIGHFILTVILSLDIMKPGYVLPAMDHSFKEIVHNSHAVGCIAVGEALMVLTLFGAVKKEQRAFKILLPGILIGVGMFALIILRNLFVLGPALEQEAQFSTYMTARIIKVGSFLERVESSISINYILIGVTKLTLLLMAASMGIARLFKSVHYKKFLMPTGILTLAISTMVFKNVMEMYDFVWVYSYLSILFQVVVPLIIWITAEIKARRNRRDITGLHNMT